MAQSTFVIVGASLAGAKAAEALRGNGFDGRILLIGDEPDPPYERPPLSKGYLMGKQDRETIFVHPSQWYADQGIDLRLDTMVTAIDRDRKAVTVSGGKTIGYDKLLLVTGASRTAWPYRVRTSTACSTCAASATASASSAPSAPRPASSSSEGAGSAWRWPPRHGRQASRPPCWWQANCH